MYYANPTVDIAAQRQELSVVKSVLFNMAILGCDDNDIVAYQALERALEAQIAEYDAENSPPPTYKEIEQIADRVDTVNRHRNVLAWVAEYLRNESYVFGTAKY